MVALLVIVLGALAMMIMLLVAIVRQPTVHLRVVGGNLEIECPNEGLINVQISIDGTVKKMLPCLGPGLHLIPLSQSDKMLLDEASQNTLKKTIIVSALVGAKKRPIVTGIQLGEQSYIFESKEFPLSPPHKD